METKEMEAFKPCRFLIMTDERGLNPWPHVGEFADHFDQPGLGWTPFRGIGSAAGRINQLIAAMTLLRQESCASTP